MVKDYVGIINGNSISIKFPYGIIQKAKASFVYSGRRIKISETEQQSGVTENDFSSPTVYTIYADDGTTADYTVTVQKIAPVPYASRNCYNNETVISCNDSSFPNQDGDISAKYSQSRFKEPSTNSGFPEDYITKDRVTGLTWKTCSEGQTGADCSVTAKLFSAIQKDTACSTLNNGDGFAGIKTWRLPSFEELLYIRDLGSSGPAIDSIAFPSTANNWYWSPAPYSGGYLNLDFGVTGYQRPLGYFLFYDYFATIDDNIRCVSGSDYRSTLDRTNNGDGTVTDNTTGLTWSKCLIGTAENSEGGCSGNPTFTSWQDALSVCKNLDLRGKNWRLPTVNDAFSLRFLLPQQPEKAAMIMISGYTTYPADPGKLVTFELGPGSRSKTSISFNCVSEDW